MPGQGGTFPGGEGGGTTGWGGGGTTGGSGGGGSGGGGIIGGAISNFIAGATQFQAQNPQQGQGVISAGVSSTIESARQISPQQVRIVEQQALTPAQAAYVSEYMKVVTPNLADPLGYYKPVAPVAPGGPALNVETMKLTNWGNVAGAREQMIGGIISQQMTPAQVSSLETGGGFSFGGATSLSKEKLEVIGKGIGISQGIGLNVLKSGNWMGITEEKKEPTRTAVTSNIFNMGKTYGRTDIGTRQDIFTPYLFPESKETTLTSAKSIPAFESILFKPEPSIFTAEHWETAAFETGKTIVGFKLAPVILPIVAITNPQSIIQMPGLLYGEATSLWQRTKEGTVRFGAKEFGFTAGTIIAFGTGGGVPKPIMERITVTESTAPRMTGIVMKGVSTEKGIEYTSVIEGSATSRTYIPLLGKQITIGRGTAEVSATQVAEVRTEPYGEMWNVMAKTTGEVRAGTKITPFNEIAGATGIKIENIPTISEKGISPYTISFGKLAETPEIKIGEYSKVLSLKPTISGETIFQGKYTMGISEKPLGYTQVELEFLSKNQPTFMKLVDIQKTTGAEAGALWRKGKLTSFDIGMEGKISMSSEGVRVHTHPLTYDISQLPSAGDVLGGRRAGYIATEAGMTRFRTTGEMGVETLFTSWENLKNIKVTETFPELVIPKGQRYMGTFGAYETPKSFEVSMGILKETGTEVTPFGTIKYYQHIAESTPNIVSGQNFRVIDWTAKGGGEVFTGGGQLQKFGGTGTVLKIGEVATKESASQSIAAASMNLRMGEWGSLAYNVLGIIPKEEVKVNTAYRAGVTLIPKEVVLTAPMQIPETSQLPVMKIGSITEQLPKSMFGTVEMTSPKSLQFNITKQIPLMETSTKELTFEITKETPMIKETPLEMMRITPLEEIMTPQLTKQVPLTETPSVPIFFTPFIPPSPPIKGGIGDMFSIPKSKLWGRGKPKYGMGSPWPHADILSVQRTQSRFGGRATQLPLTGGTLQKWAKAAGEGFGRGFPTAEIAAGKVRKGKFSIFGKKKRRR